MSVPATDIDAVARRIAPGSYDPLEVYARGLWTAIAEPGDRVAKTLVERLGASRALHAVETRSAFELSTEVAAHTSSLSTGLEPPTAAELSAGLERWRPRVHGSSLFESVRRGADLDFRLIAPGDADWPVGLDDLGPYAPIALWAEGAQGPASERAVAIVGARATSSYGQRVCADLAASVADRGVLVVSGGAVGIDSVAHRSALASGAATVAVLAGGLDQRYPRVHDELFSRIARTGALLSEVACGTPPTRWRFLQRNRLIAAMTSATVIVEAGARSGSLNTASHAASLGRPLGAVPGPVDAASSAGCHRAIRERGAVLVRSAADVFELLGDIAAAPVETPSHPGDEPGIGTRVWDALRASRPRSAGDVARETGIAVRDALAVLGRLELLGAVVRDEGGWRRVGRSSR